MTIEQAALIIRQMKMERVEAKDNFNRAQVIRLQMEAQALDILYVMAFSAPAILSEPSIQQVQQA